MKRVSAKPVHRVAEHGLRGRGQRPRSCTATRVLYRCGSGSMARAGMGLSATLYQRFDLVYHPSRLIDHILLTVSDGEQHEL